MTDFRNIDKITDDDIRQLDPRDYDALRAQLHHQIDSAEDHGDAAHMDTCNRLLDRLDRIFIMAIPETPDPGIYSLPIFGWAWQGDAQDTERY